MKSPGRFFSVKPDSFIKDKEISSLKNSIFWNTWCGSEGKNGLFLRILLSSHSSEQSDWLFPSAIDNSFKLSLSHCLFPAIMETRQYWDGFHISSY